MNPLCRIRNPSREIEVKEASHEVDEPEAKGGTGGGGEGGGGVVAAAAMRSATREPCDVGAIPSAQTIPRGPIMILLK
jgi:hypothetical protein